MQKRGYSEVEAATYLGSSTTVIKRAAANGDIPVHYLGRKKLYDREDLDRFFENLPTERPS